MEKMTWETRTFRIVLKMDDNSKTWNVTTWDIETGRLYRNNSRVFNTEGEAVRYAEWLSKF